MPSKKSNQPEKETKQVFGVKGSWIDGVVVKQLNRIPDERGCIFHMMKKEDPDFNSFGEIYFSSVYPGVIKGWHIHSKMELNYAAITGNIKLVLFDDREGSKSKGNIMEIFMGEKNYILAKVPAGVWNGFKGAGLKEAIVANLSSISHDPNEISRLDPFSEQIPYKWDLVHG